MPKTNTTTADDLAAARRQLAEHNAEGARRRAEVEALAAQEAAARAERLAAFDAWRAENIPEQMESLRAAEAEAVEQFDAAVLATPVIAAWIKMRAATGARYHLDQQLVGIANLLGRPPHQATEVWRYASLADEVLAVAEREANAQAGETADAYHSARDAAAEGRS